MKKILMIGTLVMLTTYGYGQKKSNSYNTSDSARVFVSFIAESDGTINSVKIDKIECEKCSKAYKKNISREAIRVVNEMPNLEVQKKRTRYVLPIKFKLED